MDKELDKIISKLTVRLKDVTDNRYIGTGVIYCSDELKEKVYIITASHCLFIDGDDFQQQREEVFVDILQKDLIDYQSIKVAVNPDLLFKDKKKDIAILSIDKKEIENILGETPKIKVVKEKSIYKNFIVKGFPQATFGEEIAVLYPDWLQTIDTRFQLQLKEDYTAYNTKGFSGSGVFINTEKDIFLYGIFTRFRAEEKGKVIYSQFLDITNELLTKNYLPLIRFTYFGGYGLTENFFRKQIETSITGLGPRFSEELNFQLPIAKSFNDIAKDTIFKKRLLKIFDDWILAYNYKETTEKTHLKEIENEYKEIKTQALKWVKKLNVSIDNKIDIDWLLDKLEILGSKIEVKSDELYKLRWEEEKSNPDIKKNYNHQYPYESEIGRLREIRRQNEEFIFNITKKVNIQLSNHPYLIIKGDAGNGKSHLLGDIAQKRISNNLPTLLLLGQNFVSNKNIWENIKSELNLHCSDKELLFELNNIGKQIGSRILILIDAINEGGGASLWNTRIASFINEFSEYPFIGLVLSIRTTYIDYVIPENVLKNPVVSIINHEGFKGNEYAALRLFCEFHNLKQPHFPILASEFSKPLFLKIICEAVKETEEKIFPQGFQGISSIFQLYIQTLNYKFERKREEYKNRKIVEKAIHLLAHECFNKEERVLILEEAFKLFDEKFPKFNHLINDLIEENVFIRKISYHYTTKKDEEVIYFSYERLGDFFIVEDILNKFKTKDDVLQAFQKNGELGKLNKYDFWYYSGLLEAFSVLLPEKFSLEIFEVYEWIFTDNTIDKYKRRRDEDRINQFFLNSLNWRKIDSIDDNKIIDWLKSEKFNLDYDEYLLKLYELAPVKDHPFNSDRLFRILKGIKMPKRDGFWQRHMRWFNNYNDDEIAYPIRRLIDWSWTPNISKKLDFETVRLTAQALIWLLASTHRKLRDQTTKALVNLLEQQPEALLSVLKSFKNIDDLYILERLYAVVYGCTLRTEKNESVVKIAKTVYNYVFKKGNPPNHILLRDYARNTIEYALYKNPNLKFDISLVRPPYKSKMPEYFPSKDEIKKYELDRDTSEFKQSNGEMNNRISFSVLEWDFGRYTVDSNLRHFHSLSFTFKDEYKLFFNSLNKNQKQIITLINRNEKACFQFTNNQYRVKNLLGEDKYNSLLQSIKDLSDWLLVEAKKIFDELQMNFLKNKVLPHLKGIYKKDNKYNHTIDTKPIKRWIVKRVFDLGYDYKIHGDYDRSSENYSDRSENKIERIGKKYQWIALFEISAMIADNYKVYDDWSDKATYYKGPWQMYLRDIDPAFTSRSIIDDEDEIEPILEIKNWYDEPKYNNWVQNDAEWVDNLLDLPSVKDILEKKDENSDGWLSLKKTVKWKESKSVGQDEYKRRRKEIFYMFQGYLINKRDKSKIINWLCKQNFWGRWMPETSNPLSLINRENFWSPAYKDICKTKKWETIQDTNYKVIIASTDAVGEMADDKSDAHFYYDMPCKTLFEGMNLSYAPLDGDFTNDEGKIIAKNINHKNLMFRKRELLDYLKENNLEIIWTLLGEKMSYDSRERENTYFKELSGVFYIENDAITGKIISFDRK